jgi:hypothetical protein
MTEQIPEKMRAVVARTTRLPTRRVAGEHKPGEALIG